jgi:hypothetical protein
MQTKFIPYLLFLFSAVYYYILSAKEWTWLFVSNDSGDWLASANLWFVPQPFGSPVYIFLTKIAGLLPFDLIFSMTFLLSVIPSAVTIAMIYLICKKATGKIKFGLIGSSIALVNGVLLSQSIIIEEYALAVMLVTIGFWAYISNKKKITVVSLGLATGVHVIPAILTLMLLFVEKENIKEWLKYWWLFILFGVLPYIYIPIIMLLPDTPRWMIGELSLQAFNEWLGAAGSVFGSLSIADTPTRIQQFVVIILASFGLSLIGLWTGFKKPWGKEVKFSIIAIAICSWVYATNLDFTTWTFLSYTVPFVCYVSVIGLQKISIKYTKAVLVWLVLLFMANSLFLNADILSKKDNQAMTFWKELQELPKGSAVVVPRGCATGFGMFYLYTQGRSDLVIIFQHHDIDPVEQNFKDYLIWFEKEYGFTGKNTMELALNAMLDKRPVYFIEPVFDKWEKAFLLEKTGEYVNIIKEVNLEPNWDR